MSPLNIFLDDGGVITDKQRRAAQFERLVGDCFVPLLGGTEEAWTHAHLAVVDRLELAGSFEGMGVRHCFRRFYGADLVNVFKEGPEYYARLFTDAGVQP